MNIVIGTDIELVKAADELRQAVFINEQGVPKEEIFDGLSFQSVHVVCFDGTLPVATARALKDGNVWRIGLVAVAKSRRGQHLGEKVMEATIDYITKEGGKEIMLVAQEQVRGFYEKLKFAQDGEVTKFESGFVLVPMKYRL